MSAASVLIAELGQAISLQYPNYLEKYGPVTGQLAVDPERPVSARIKLLCSILGQTLSKIDQNHYIDLDYADPELAGGYVHGGVQPSALIMARPTHRRGHLSVPLTWTARAVTIGATPYNSTPILVLLHANDAGERLTGALTRIAGRFFSTSAAVREE